MQTRDNVRPSRLAVINVSLIFLACHFAVVLLGWIFTVLTLPATDPFFGPSETILLGAVGRLLQSITLAVVLLFTGFVMGPVSTSSLRRRAIRLGIAMGILDVIVNVAMYVNIDLLNYRVHVWIVYVVLVVIAGSRIYIAPSTS